MKITLLEAAISAAAAGRASAIVTELNSGAQTLVQGSTPGAEQQSPLADPELSAAVDSALARDRSGAVELTRGRFFIDIFNPPLRCFVIGAVHVAQSLEKMAALTGHAVTIIDPRQAFATESRFPGAALVTEWPDDALRRLAPNRRSAVVTLTHDPKIDDPALITALRSEAYYIGALGSRRTHAARCERLADAGFAPSDIARIRGPVGLDIGAVSPAEIAVSILAEMIATLHQDRPRHRVEAT